MQGGFQKPGLRKIPDPIDPTEDVGKETPHQNYLHEAKPRSCTTVQSTSCAALRSLQAAKRPKAKGKQVEAQEVRS